MLGIAVVSVIQYHLKRFFEGLVVIRTAQRGFLAELFERRADSLRSWFNSDWWSVDLERFYTSIVEGEKFDTTLVPLLQILPLYYGIVDPGSRRERFIDNLQAGSLVEVNVYLAEAYYRHGRNEEGFRP